MVSVQRSVHTGEWECLSRVERVVMGMVRMGMSVGSRGGSQEVQGKWQTVRRVTGKGKERRCGSAEVEVWCRADESVVGVKRDAVGFQSTSGDGFDDDVRCTARFSDGLVVKWIAVACGMHRCE